MIKYMEIVPEGSFLHMHMTALANRESPYAYDFWSGVWLLSLALGRDVYVPRPDAPVYMNWYVLLVADSGVTRKSSIVNNAEKIARKFIDAMDGEMMLIETRTSPEAMELRLQEHTLEYGYAHAAIVVSELATFLGKERYNLHMPALLTDLYDSPYIRTGGGTISRGVTKMRNVYVNFLSASTASWLVRAVNPDVIEGGFTSRCIFIHDEKRKQKVAWPSEDKKKKITKKQLVRYLVNIRTEANDVKEIKIQHSALQAFERWYNEREEHRDPFRASFEAREDAHVLRLAATLAANANRWVITKGDIRDAITVIASCKEGASALFAGTSVTSRIVLGIDKLRETLIEAGISGCTQTTLLTKCRNYINAEEMTTALVIMQELGMVQQFKSIGGTVGKPSTTWRGTRDITGQGSMEMILNRLEPTR